MQLNDTIERLESNIRGYVRSFPTVFQSAKGAWLTDNRGKRYLDFFAGAGTLNYGHNNPLVKKALLSFLENDGVMHGLDTATTAKIELLEAIDEILLKPRGLDYKVQFSGPTGTNAVEAAIKLARKSKQRSHIVAVTNAYHGHSLGSLALTGNQYYHDMSYGSHNNVTHLPYDGYLGDLDTSLLSAKDLRLVLTISNREGETVRFLDRGLGDMGYEIKEVRQLAGGLCAVELVLAGRLVDVEWAGAGLGGVKGLVNHALGGGYRMQIFIDNLGRNSVALRGLGVDFWKGNASVYGLVNPAIP